MFKLEYLPWSQRVLKEALNDFRVGKLPILDLELSGLCKLKLLYGGCIYCDSASGRPHIGETSMHDLVRLINQGLELGLKWIFICGLGEPKDDTRFYELVRFLTDNDISLSIFSNGVFYDSYDVDFLYSNHVHLIIKCDSFNPVVFSRLLGAPVHIAESIYRTIHMLLERGYGDKGGPSLALSIVPTKVNLQDVVSVVNFCVKNKIFPLIGQLEYAGRAKSIYDQLAPARSELIWLKNEIERVLGYTYEIPVCPAAMTSLHVSNTGDYIVDANTGLSCFWFHLLEPTIKVLGNIRTHSVVEMLNEMKHYRKQKMEDIKRWLKICSENIFGGCGGYKLLEEYLGFLEKGS